MLERYYFKSPFNADRKSPKWNKMKTNFDSIDGSNLCKMILVFKRLCVHAARTEKVQMTRLVLLQRKQWRRFNWYQMTVKWHLLVIINIISGDRNLAFFAIFNSFCRFRIEWDQLHWLHIFCINLFYFFARWEWCFWFQYRGWLGLSNPCTSMDTIYSSRLKLSV